MDLANVDFGKVAAEDEAAELARYFLETREYSDLIDDKNITLVTGRKGSGKSAIFVHLRNTFNSPPKTSVITVDLDAHAWAVHKELRDETGSSQRAYVASWNYILLIEITKWLLKYEAPHRYMFFDLNYWRKVFDANRRTLNRFMKQTYGKLAPEFKDILLDKARNLVEVSLGVLGLKTSAESNSTRRISHNIATAAAYLQKIVFAVIPHDQTLYILFDQLDRAWSQADDIQDVLIGLIIAGKDMVRETERVGKDVRVIIFLRDDIFSVLRFQDKNKFTQDGRIELTWDAANLKGLIDRRVEHSAGLTWEKIVTEEIIGNKQDAMSYIIARTLLRPRDVISFCRQGLFKARERQNNKILKQDIIDAEANYSQAIYNEYLDETQVSHPNFEFYCNIIRNIGLTQFTLDQFQAKFQSTSDGENTSLTATEILRELVDLSVLGIKQSGKWVYKYSDPAMPAFSRRDFDEGQEFQVHESLKKALALKRPRRRQDSIVDENEEE